VVVAADISGSAHCLLLSLVSDLSLALLVVHSFLV
jgi:hypothetical protein